MKKEVENLEATDIEHSNISGEAKNKIIRLFTYLEKSLAINNLVVRDFRTSLATSSPWWLADYPTDLENLYIRPFDTEKTSDDVQSSSWLRVEKKNIKAAPDLPDQLLEWIEGINPLQAPEPKQTIDRKVLFIDDTERVNSFKQFRKNFEQGEDIPENLADWVSVSPNKLPDPIDFRYLADQWIDHPELHKLLNVYVENKWKAWSEEVKKIYQANLLYDQLYALRLLLKNEGDSFELLLGHGVLTWQHKSVGTIYAPIFLTPITLDFDASKRIIEINPDPVFRGFTEISSLFDTDNPAEMDLIALSDKINATPFDFWHFESLKLQAKTFINYISTEGEDDFNEKMVAAPPVSKHPTIWNAPVIFSRKRTNDLWSKYAAKIRKEIEQHGSIATEFITDLIGEYDQDLKGNETFPTTEKDGQAHISIPDSELHFPLPWNDEQKRIAERLDSSYGVVVKGPPGTGKSHTIANLISRCLAQGKSVLVTSQTSKALEVLRDKLPANIRSLAVSQLQQTAKRDDVLQQSISEISSNLGERNTKFSETRAQHIRNELKNVREEKSIIASKIRQYILTDSSEKISIDGQDIKPIDAAKFVCAHKDSNEVAWFTDVVNFTDVLDFSEDDLRDIYNLSHEVEKNDRKLYKQELPPLESLPSEDSVLGAFALFEELSDKSRDACDSLSITNIDQQKLFELRENLTKAKKVLDSIRKDYEQEIFYICGTSQSERENWQTIISKISEKILIAAKAKNGVLGHVVSGSSSLSVRELYDGVNILFTKISGRTRIGTFTKMLLPTNAKKALEAYKVDGVCPDTREKLEVLRNSVAIELSEQDIRVLLEQGFASLKSDADFYKDRIDLPQLEIFTASLQRLVNYYSDFTILNIFFSEIAAFSDLSFLNKKDVEKAIDLATSYTAMFELQTLEKTLEEWFRSLKSSTKSDNAHEIFGQLIQSIRDRDASAWKNNLEKLQQLEIKKRKSIRLHELNEKLSKRIPILFTEIIELADKNKKFDCPKNLSLAWKISRLESWISHIHDHQDIDTLQSDLERLNKREFQLNSELVTILAWQRQIDKVTKRQRDALMAWSDAMKKYGKGSGKYANKWLNAAQLALKEAKSAVPVWIMPIHRAAQMFSDPVAGMFDVVIFDEASQCDIRGLTIGYLGKKLLIVGDPDQISPAGIFQDQEKTFELISRFLFDIPHRDSFSITTSLFDLAQIRIPNMIQLNEHFRCVPEIIGFSNHYIYDSKLKPLRHPHPKGLLKPSLVPVLVEGGYQNTNNKVNEPEAKAIVEKLVECLENPNYQKRPDGHLCTFGIISLLAEDQAKYIKELILRHPKIGEKVIEERKIICGDAYTFQGDERDVIFLSMVKALDPNNPNDTVKALADKGAAQRFNVAATRARDQVFLYHSIPLQEFRNQEDWRYRLLNWYYDPKTEELRAGREALRKEFDSGRASQFSYDVGNLLIDRGYQVLPEYPVIGYRIDLVVQGSESRLAVECDGDQYHTLENWEEDQVREQQLRRAGWEFWRVTGSAFYCHKEKALDSLWKKLDELDIKPLADQKK